ncbi:hypothetical protein PRIPAC_72286 [Pristionchus pacificus]|uniref:Uncharacterized protein n=1 Tax=Pristionchus pacificus TaxID=54126 RepID=A0A2A6C0T5_PRIPA|nr:hypothetical protein PRIPAC_72286 [Pristionchus pacificus]|eukprot:PDM71760.1 hypothetical protein PRIPAC_38167 [Pristionchus pacificus]
MWHNTPSISSSDGTSPSFLSSPCFIFEACSPSSPSFPYTPSSIFPLHPLPPSILATMYSLLITDDMLEQAIGTLQQQRRTREEVYEEWESCERRNGEIPSWILTPVKQAHESFLADMDQEEARLQQLLWTRRIVAALNYPQLPPVTTKCSPVEKLKRRRYRPTKDTSHIERRQLPTKQKVSLLEFLEDATQVIMRLFAYSEIQMEIQAAPVKNHHCKNGDTHESSDSMKEEDVE